jgi:DNA-binding CsgD family transcriptional regulator
LKDPHEDSATERAETPHDITDTWPFVERRKGDRRRGGDRRRAAVQSEQPPPDYVAQEITGREREIVDLLLQGMTNKQIAETLGIAVDTVKKHLQHVYKKLGVRRRALLIADRSGSGSGSR